MLAAPVMPSDYGVVDRSVRCTWYVCWLCDLITVCEGWFVCVFCCATFAVNWMGGGVQLASWIVHILL